MLRVLQTIAFRDWLDQLGDARVQARIAARIRMLEAGHFGDWKAIDKSVAEIRINVGPGYRVYFTRRGRTVVVLLAGGDKSSQRRDIERATRIAATLEEQS